MKKRIFFYGICGSSMSALACIAASKYEVWGYDDNTPNTQHFCSLGINITKTLDYNIIKTCALVVYTCAIKNTDKLKNFCATHHIKLLERAEYLGILAKQFATTIAISGTHGKTTTTAMIGSIFSAAKLSPTMHLGGISNDWGQNYLVGKSDIFITEACEYNRSFLHLFPTTSVITNIEAEHLDTYGNFENVKSAFKHFANQTKQNIVICGDNLDKAIFASHVTTFGINTSNDIYATNISQNNACYTFDCVAFGKNIGSFSLCVMGKHNMSNALASITVALIHNIPITDIQTGINNFHGVKRRLSLLGSTNLGTHYHDYAHHPTEIKVTLNTLAQLPHKKLIAVFQPHTYSRTLSLMNDFGSCFDLCDELFLLPTYSAREDYIVGGDSTDLFYKLNGRVNCQYFTNIESLGYELEKNLCAGDIVVWLGAGNIDNFAQYFIQKNKL